jgi:hypothetical protein
MGDMDDNILRRAVKVIADAEQRGYRKAMAECQSHLEMLASVIPSSVTKAWFVDHVAREIKTL